MGKAVWQVLLCVSVAWVLMVSYQMFTETAVKSLISLMLSFATLLENLIAASTYLSMPYVIMLAIDLKARKISKKRIELENVTNAYLEDAAVADQKLPRSNH
ncbi:MAG: hypothetical protein QXX79_03650 [Candidatus Bathyarchaeia archaeon]